MVFCGANFHVSKVPVAPTAVRTKAESAVNNAARKTSNIRDFATELKQRLEPTMGVGWHIVVGGDFAVDLRYREGACVLLFSKVGKMKVLLYRTAPSVSPRPAAEHEALARERSELVAKTKVVVLDSDMEDEMANAVMQRTTRLYSHFVATANSESKIAESLKHSLTFTYGPTWQVVVTSCREFCCLHIADKGLHIDFTVSKLRVVVYRHAGTSLDRQLDSAQFGKRVAFVLAMICMLLYVFLSFASSETTTKCESRSDENRAVDGVVLPEGCSSTDVTRANDHAWWKFAAMLGMVACTMVASLIRMYAKSLSPKIKCA
ncbi:unnamed protein product [Hyaloperonospora brassicae]|uniref:Dynein light chain n=1 Tax=Hyaloperonospora brassicae TaxID=162125 RepID=A0AAV0UFW8_HYABA|nr:unnamed protein product [Hyaloperonospora brassicae]